MDIMHTEQCTLMANHCNLSQCTKLQLSCFIEGLSATARMHLLLQLKDIFPIEVAIFAKVLPALCHCIANQKAWQKGRAVKMDSSKNERKISHFDADVTFTTEPYNYEIIHGLASSSKTAIVISTSPLALALYFTEEVLPCDTEASCMHSQTSRFQSILKTAADRGL